MYSLAIVIRIIHVRNDSHRPSVCHRRHRDYFGDWWLNGAAYVWRSVTTPTAYTSGGWKGDCGLGHLTASAPSTAP